MRESGQSRFFLEKEKPIKIKIKKDHLDISDSMKVKTPKKFKKTISTRSVLPSMNNSPIDTRKTRKMLGSSFIGNKSPPIPVNRVSTLGIREYGENETGKTPHRSRSGSYNRK